MLHFLTNKQPCLIQEPCKICQKSKKMAENKEPEESLIEHIFAIDLAEIKLITDNPIDCTVKYSYKLFHHQLNPEFTTEPLIVTGDKKWQEVSECGFEQYKLSARTKEADIQSCFESNPLEIKVYDKNFLIGTARFDLSKKELMEVGYSYTKKEKILSEHLDGTENFVWIIRCKFGLKKENCSGCKSCGLIFKNSVIRKHISKGNCKKDYSPSDMAALDDQSRKRQREMRAIWDRKKYDPEARSKRHKETYDSKKRKESYDLQKRQEIHKRSMAENSYQKRKK